MGEYDFRGSGGEDDSGKALDKALILPAKKASRDLDAFFIMPCRKTSVLGLGPTERGFVPQPAILLDMRGQTALLSEIRSQTATSKTLIICHLPLSV